ncbi:MAG: sodium:solute symporter family transporter, partial [Egibacteraceae bacterium]
MVTEPVTLSLLLFTLTVFVWVGVRAARRGDVEDYVVARNSQPPLTLGLSFLGAGLGAWVLFAPSEVGATVGVVAVVGYAVGCGVPVAALAWLGPRLRDIVPAGLSLVQFVRLRFGRTFHAYVAGISILYMLVFVTAELTAIGGVVAILSQAEVRTTIVAVAAATLAYTTYGGLRASLRTDRFQGWLILGLLGLTTWAVLAQPGWQGAAPAEQAPARPAVPGLPVAITLIIAVTAANAFHQGYWQRVWAARDTRALRTGVWLGTVLTVPVVGLLGWFGMVAAGRGLELGSPPVPFFALLNGAPVVVLLVVLSLSIALVSASVDTLESGLASLVTAERPTMTLAQARAVTVLLMVPAVAVALRGYSVLQLFLIADLLCAATVVPALLSLWSRATPAGALAGSVAGLVGAVGGGWIAGGSLGAGLEA